MKTVEINVRALLILVATMLGLAVTVHLVHGFQVRRNAVGLFREAESAWEDGEHARAIQLLQRYVRLAPEDTEALAKLGFHLGEVGSSRRAYDRLAQVLGRNPERDDVRRELASLAITLRRHADAERFAASILEDEVDDGEMLAILGRAQLGMGKPAEATTTLERAIRSATDDLDSYVLLAGLQRRELEEPETADATMDAMVERNEREARAHVYRGTWHLALLGETGRGVEDPNEDETVRAVLESIGRDANRALELEPEDRGVLLFATRAARRRGRLEDARSYAERCVSIDPKSAEAYLQLSEIEEDGGRPDAAIEWLRRGREAVPKSTLLTVALAESLLKRVDAAAGVVATERLLTEEVEPLVDDLASDRSANEAIVALLRGRMALARRDWSEARRRLEIARNIGASRPGFTRSTTLLLDEVYERLRLPERRIASVERALDDDADWVEGRWLLARLLSAVDVDRAQREYERIGGNPAIVIELAQATITRELEGDPAGVTPERLADLKHRIDGLLAPLPNRDEIPAIPLLNARIHLAGGDVDAARSELEASLERHADDVSTWRVRAESELLDANVAAVERWTRFRAVLSRAREAVGDDLSLSLSEIEGATVADRETAFAVLKRFEEDAAGLATIDRTRVLSHVARAYRSMASRGDERRVLIRLGELDARDLASRFRLGEILLAANEFELLTPVIDEVRAIEGPDGASAAFLEANRELAALRREFSGNDGEVSSRRVADVRRLLESVAEARPGWPAAARLQGALAVLVGNDRMARAHYEEAYRLGDRETETIGHLVESLFAADRVEEAYRLLQESWATTPGNFETRFRALASDAIRRRFTEDRPLDADESPTDLLLLARVRHASGQRGAAVEEPIRRALDKIVARRPEAAFGVFLALVDHLVDEGRLSDARVEVDRAEEVLPKRPEAARLLGLARLHEAALDFEEARTRYAAVLARFDEDPAVRLALAAFSLRQGELDESQKHVDWLIAARESLSRAEYDAALRWRVRLLAARNRWDDALGLARSNRRRGRLGADLRLEAAILARRNRLADRDALIDVLREIDRIGGGLDSTERLQLAVLLDARERWPESRQAFESVLRTAGPQERRAALIGYARALCDRNELDLANEHLSELESIAPDSIATRSARALWHVARGNADSAVRELTAYAAVNAAGEPRHDVARTLFDIAIIEGADGVARLVELGLDTESASALAKAATAGMSADRLADIVASLDPENELGALAAAERQRLVAIELERLDLLDAAREHFTRYATRGKRRSPRLYLIRFLLRHDDLPAALEECDRAWDDCAPEDAALATIAVLRRTGADEDRVEEVRRRLTAALAAEPGQRQLTRALAELEDLVGNYDDVERSYRDALKADSADVIALNNLAWLLAMRGRQPEEALRLAERAVEMAPRAIELLDTRATAYVANRRFDEAITDVERLVSFSPSPSHLFRAAWVYWRAGRSDDARRLWNDSRRVGMSIDDLHSLDRIEFEAMQTVMDDETTRVP